MERGTVIQISDKFKATWDGSNNWELEELTTIKPKGKYQHMEERQDWKAIGYFGKVNAMLAHIIKYRLVAAELEGNTADLEEVLHTVKKAHADFQEVLKQYE